VGFLRRLLDGAEHRTATTGLANPADWLGDAMGLTASYSGERVTVRDGFGLGPVYSAVSIIAETIGGLPLKVFRMLEDGDARVESRNHRMYRVLHDKPNPVTPADRFWSTVAAQLLLWGNVYIEKERGVDGLVESLWLVDPSCVVVEWDGRRKSFYADTLEGRKRWTDETMIHIHGLSLNGITGESPIATCRQSFGTTIARSKFEGGFYKRGARSPAVIEHPGRLGRSGTDNLANSFAAWHGGVDNMHKVPVLEEGAKLNTLSMPLADMQFVESQQLSRTEIATIFKIPPAYLGGSTGDSLTYATIESNQIQFAQLAIVPWTNTIAKALSADPGLFPQNVIYPEFVIEGLMKADVQARSAYWKTMKELGVVDADYIATRENLPPPPDEEPAPVPAVDPAQQPNMPPQLVQLPNASSQ